jgi:hypothetical protein
MFLSAFAVQSYVCEKINSWQLEQLFKPKPYQFHAEDKGRIMIYRRHKDTDVQRALDEQFYRIESMMFTSVVVTNGYGNPRINQKIGSIIVENDFLLKYVIWNVTVYYPLAS